MSALCASGTASDGVSHASRRGRSGLSRFVVLASLLAAAGFAAPASAAPPANDARTAAQNLGKLPALVSGTTVDATLEEDEPPSAAGVIKNSVWFSFSVSANRDLLVALDAAGDLDATVDLFVRERSQLLLISGQRTNRRGEWAGLRARRRRCAPRRRTATGGDGDAGSRRQRRPGR